MGGGASKKAVMPASHVSAHTAGPRASHAKALVQLQEANARLAAQADDLKQARDQSREQTRQHAQALEEHRARVAALTVEINRLRAGDDDEWGEENAGKPPYLSQLRNKAPGSAHDKKRVSGPGDLATFHMSRHNITRRVSLAAAAGNNSNNHSAGRSMAEQLSASASGSGGKSVADTQNRAPSRIAKQLNLHRRGKTMSAKNAAHDLDAAAAAAVGGGALGEGLPQVVHRMPRGGVYVHTKAGPVQFGIPPETVKDSMNMGLDVPTVFVVPRERFNMQMGVNVSEIEFPAFFNFFVRRKQMTLVTYEDCSDDLFTIMKEALDGPDPHELYIEEEYSRFASKATLDARPDHVKEMGYFCEPRPGTPSIKVSNLIKFAYFNALGECALEDGVVIKDESYGFTVLQDDGVIAAISDDEAKSCYFPGAPPRGPPPPPPDDDDDDDDDDNDDNDDDGDGDKASKDPSASKPAPAEAEAEEEEPEKMFIIPRFGLTILGNSHGFDPSGSTSGFVIWINGQGIMVDPPPHSGEFLKRSGIQPKLISATILTHCHADHDAGTIQKVITEDKVTLMTTKTIFNSLLRKYAGVAGLGTDFLRQLVNFRPVFVEEPTYWGGACFRFFYTLHAIPCVGFEVSFEGKRIVYSADTFFEPAGLEAICERGILSRARCDALLNFPWDCDVVLHEAGVPPIHTPLSAFESVPEAYRRNIQLIHIGTKDQKDAIERGFRVSRPGIENTVVLLSNTETQETLRFLQLIASVDIFRGFPITQALELLLMSRTACYDPGEVIAEKGTPGDKFMVILSGEASVSFGSTKKVFKVGDYLGEISVITGEDRTATIVAEKACSIVEVDKYAFHYFLMKDKKLYAKMENLVKARMDGSWHAIARNSVLRNLSAAQKTSLQAFLHVRNCKRDEVIWRKGDAATGAALLLSGDFVFDEVHRADPFELLTATQHPHQARGGALGDDDDAIEFEPLSTGAFVCDMFAMTTNSELTVTLTCASEEGVLFFISQENVLGFLDANPMTLLALLKTIVIL